jgi:hypothetical protein
LKEVHQYAILRDEKVRIAEVLTRFGTIAMNGTIGHVVILSSDAKDYLHVHPMDTAAKGPDAVFHTEFPSSGTFKIWGQFQHQGNVFTVPFVVHVP